MQGRRQWVSAILLLSCVAGAAASCDTGDDAPAAGGASWRETAIEPTSGYRNRQAEYLQYCSENSGPGGGGMHGQVCRAYTAAGSFNEEAIRSKLDKINHREDTSDFDFNSLVRVLILDRRRPSLPAGLRADMEQTVLNFKFWLDEPGADTLC